MSLLVIFIWTCIFLLWTCHKIRWQWVPAGNRDSGTRYKISTHPSINKEYDITDMVQNRSLHYFVRVHRFAPKLAVNGDVGWLPAKERRWCNTLQYWNRLIDRPKKNIYVFQVSRPYLDFCPHPKHLWIVSKMLSNLVENGGKCI